mgnify:CR=1 FL=1
MLAELLPEGLTAGIAALLVAASFFTSALTATFGLGGGLAMLALLGLFVPASALIPVHGAIQLGSNTGRAWHQRAHVRRDIFVPFALGSVVGAVLGVFVVVQLPDAVMKLALGGFILAITWARIPGVEKIGRAGLTAASVVLSVLSMIFGATGPLLNAVLAQFMLGDRKALVATHAATMTAQHLLKVIVFGVAGFAFASWLPLIAVMIGSGYLGTIYGSRLLDRMPQEAFGFWFRILISALALDMLRRGLLGLF